MPAVRQEWALRVQARDLVQPAFAFGLVRHGQGEIAAAGLTGDDQVGDPEVVAVGVRPPDSGGAIVEAGGERVWAELARGVAELDTDDDEPCAGEVFATAR